MILHNGIKCYQMSMKKLQASVNDELIAIVNLGGMKSIQIVDLNISLNWSFIIQQIDSKQNNAKTLFVENDCVVRTVCFCKYCLKTFFWEYYLALYLLELAQKRTSKCWFGFLEVWFYDSKVKALPYSQPFVCLHKAGPGSIS